MTKELNDLLERIKPKLVKSDEQVDASDKALATILKESEAIQSEILKHSDAPKQQSFSFLPTELTRISPFFPMRRGQKGLRPLERIRWEHSWGEIEFSGEKLSIKDETVLLIILSLVKKQGERTIRTTCYEICKEMGIRPQRDNYRSIWESIRRLTGTSINLTVKDKIKMVNTILSGGKVEEESGKILLSLNEYFLSMYAQSLITHINLSFRKTLKGDFSKALYRFLTSQKDHELNYHILTLAKVINIDVQKMELKVIRRRIRSGLKELRAKGFLSRWQIRKNDIVYIWKAKKPTNI